tara:strand:- start:1091 stop:1339 length:249 start_codon:yes stop_codon:yes gene_type:complete
MEKNFSINEFNTLIQHDQYDLVFTKGDFVNYYLNGNTRYALYALFRFFVEIEFNTTQNKIMNLVAFEEGKLLERYWIITNLK